MSAIWGCIDFSGKALPDGLCETMQKPFDQYKIDRYSNVTAGNIVMGCAIQYITAESVNEPLPIYDEDLGIFFTADCFIDNRLDLMNELGVEDGAIPDGMLFFEA